MNLVEGFDTYKRCKMRADKHTLESIACHRPLPRESDPFRITARTFGTTFSPGTSAAGRTHRQGGIAVQLSCAEVLAGLSNVLTSLARRFFGSPTRTFYTGLCECHYIQDMRRQLASGSAGNLLIPTSMTELCCCQLPQLIT